MHAISDDGMLHGRYTAYALQDPRISWSLASVEAESRLVGGQLQAQGLSTATLRAWQRRQPDNNGTLVCRFGAATPTGCTVESYLAGTGECLHNHCYLDPCFSCVAVGRAMVPSRGLRCGGWQRQHECEAAMGCSWRRGDAVDCW